ncbi:hypothetical protein V8C35DRAFT_312969, partial [Trichoderma chlorosporum]
MTRKEAPRRSSRSRKRSRRSPSRTPTTHGSAHEKAHENQVGRPMIRFLLETYSTEQIDRMFDEESRALLQSPLSPLEDNDEFSMLTEPESQSVLPSPISGGKISPSVSSISSCGDVESKTTANSTTDSEQTEKPVPVTTTARMASIPPSHLVHTFKSVIQETSTARKKDFTCGLCAEQGLVFRYTRAHDLKRHIDNSHQSDTWWICEHSDCRMVFRWLDAYTDHMKTFHPKSRLRIGASKAAEQRSQAVSSVDEWGEKSESPSALDAPLTNKRLQKLPEKTDQVGYWPPAELSEQQTLNWDSQSGSVFQKQIETQNVDSRDSLASGSNSSRQIQLAQAKVPIPGLKQRSELMHHKTTAIAPMPVATAAFTPCPMTATATFPASVPMMASGITGNETSLVGHGYMDVANASYQQQSLTYQYPMQNAFHSVPTPNQLQQYNAADWSDTTQWINFGDEDNRRL